MQTARTKRSAQRLAGAALAAGAIALAAAAATMETPRPAEQGAAPQGEASFIHDVALHRWGYGALDWLLPDRGDRDDRCDRNRRC